MANPQSTGDPRQLNSNKGSRTLCNRYTPPAGDGFQLLVGKLVAGGLSANGELLDQFLAKSMLLYNPRQITVPFPSDLEIAWAFRKTLGTDPRADRGRHRPPGAVVVHAGRARMPSGFGAARAVPNGCRNMQLFRGCE